MKSLEEAIVAINTDPDFMTRNQAMLTELNNNPEVLKYLLLESTDTRSLALKFFSVLNYGYCLGREVEKA